MRTPIPRYLNDRAELCNPGTGDTNSTSRLIDGEYLNSDGTRTKKGEDAVLAIAALPPPFGNPKVVVRARTRTAPPSPAPPVSASGPALPRENEYAQSLNHFTGGPVDQRP